METDLKHKDELLKDQAGLSLLGAPHGIILGPILFTLNITGAVWPILRGLKLP